MITAEYDDGTPSFVLGVGHMAALFPYNVDAFRSFRGLFKTGQINVVNVGNAVGIPRWLEGLRNFLTQPSSSTVLNKFLSQFQICRTFNFDGNNKERRHNLDILHRRYDKLFRLVFSNSVLFQHFGCYNHNRDERPCRFAKLDVHKICVVHVSSLNSVVWHKSKNADTVYDIEEIMSQVTRYEDVNFFGEMDGESEDDENDEVRFDPEEQFRGQEDLDELIFERSQCEVYRMFGTVLNIN